MTIFVLIVAGIILAISLVTSNTAANERDAAKRTAKYYEERADQAHKARREETDAIVDLAEGRRSALTTPAANAVRRLRRKYDDLKLVPSQPLPSLSTYLRARGFSANEIEAIMLIGQPDKQEKIVSLLGLGDAA